MTQSGGFQVADHVEQGGLAGPRGSRQRDEVALVDVQVQAVQHGDLLRAALVGLGEVADRNQGCHGRAPLGLWGRVARKWRCADVSGSVAQELRIRADESGRINACEFESPSPTRRTRLHDFDSPAATIRTLPPSSSSAGGSSTTVSPADSPDSTWRPSPRLPPSFSVRRSTVPCSPSPSTKLGRAHVCTPVTTA